MGVRNCADLGENAQLVMKRLLSNQNLVKLLYYNDKDPLSQPDLTESQIAKEVFEKLVKIVPRVGPKETANSLVVIRVSGGSRNGRNSEFKTVTFNLEIFCPLTQWIIKDVQLRPFAILGEIDKSLNGKSINGLGKMQGGDFALNFLTEEIGCYEVVYSLTSYE